GHTATLLANGRVLIAGGQNAAGVENSAEVFDPATGVSGLVGFMNSPRSGHTAIALADGRVFIAGGNAAGTAEIYDPSDGPLGAFTALPNALARPRSGHTATLFSDHSVLLAGGSAVNPDTLESFDPADLSFTLSPFPLTTPHSGHAAIPTLDGKLLIFGGNDDGTVEEYDPATLQVRTVATLNSPDSTAVGLANGNALVLWPGNAGVFVPGANTFAPLAESGALLRTGATATELPTDNNKILVAGGLDNANEFIPNGALFNPAKISTDYDDYPAGSPVGIYGSGYFPGETVRWQVLHTDGGDNDTSSTGIHAPRDTTADANGNFSVIWDIPANE